MAEYHFMPTSRANKHIQSHVFSDPRVTHGTQPEDATRTSNGIVLCSTEASKLTSLLGEALLFLPQSGGCMGCSADGWPTATPSPGDEPRKAEEPSGAGRESYKSAGGGGS